MRLHRHTIVAFVLLALTATPVAAAPPSKDAAARAEHDRIVKFWTPQRMAAAKPRDFVRTPSGFVPASNHKGNGKGKPGGGSSDPNTVTGATWTGGGDVSEAVGKVFFKMDGSFWTCSGSVAAEDSSDHSLVLTAAHCAYDETNGEFATDWMFIPAWGSQPATRTTACDATLYGCWTAKALVVHSGYANAGGFTDEATWHDFAFAAVGAGGKGGSVPAQLDQAVPSFQLNVNSVAKDTQVFAFGYPAAQKYKGNTLTYCAGRTIEDAWNDNKTWGVGCDMTGGSSGGPWLANFNTSTGTGVLGSLNSYGYMGVKNMYGPKFNSKTQAVYNAANSTTSNTIVGP